MLILKFQTVDDEGYRLVSFGVNSSRYLSNRSHRWLVVIVVLQKFKTGYILHKFKELEHSHKSSVPAPISRQYSCERESVVNSDRHLPSKIGSEQNYWKIVARHKLLGDFEMCFDDKSFS